MIRLLDFVMFFLLVFVFRLDIFISKIILKVINSSRTNCFIFFCFDENIRVKQTFEL